MPKILRNCVVAIAGDLDDNEWREEKVRGWVKYQGGKFSDVVDETVTHLLCTKENYESRIGPVKAALRNKTTKIVQKDWLEDSITKKSCLKDPKYQWITEEKKKIAKQKKLEEAKKCSENAHFYVDEQATFRKPPVHLDEALKKFKAWFKKKTGIAWNERIDKAGTMGPEHFQYQPPAGGKPVGLLDKRPVSGPAKGAQNSNSQVKQKAKAIEVDRKRAREKHAVSHVASKADGAERPAKRPRHEEAETVRAYAKSKGISTKPEEVTSVASSPEDNDQNNQDNNEQQSTDESVTDTPSDSAAEQAPRNVATSESISNSSNGIEQESSPRENYAQATPFSAHIDALLHYLEHETKEPGSQGDADPPTPCGAPQQVEASYPEVDDDYYAYSDEDNNDDGEYRDRDSETRDLESPLSPAGTQGTDSETTRGAGGESDSQA
ncbi:hypothetical protein NPX13_g10779 [Xylaria arbuscula]|uniref:BRCT domain-containing protein n=1 Tax=Xylaria arbuscula TaxID=114810 RepID=A0A9W8N448_9PEZI|nr:hypothetical protein NPX13_g10779 [Xylaria arbuscula]